MSKRSYKEMSLQELWILLSFLEQTLRVYTELQDKINYHVEKGILTASEVVVLVEKSTAAYVELDRQTIEIEKAMDTKVRSMTGIKDLSGSVVRMSGELEKLISERKDSTKENTGKNKAPIKLIP